MQDDTKVGNDILDVYQSGESKTNLLLVRGDWVINGAWRLGDPKASGFSKVKVGTVEAIYTKGRVDYNATLSKFEKERQL